MELISKTDNYLASLAAKMSRTSKQLSATAEVLRERERERARERERERYIF